MAGRFGDDDAGKVFLGGLSWETTEDDLYEYFEKFGTISSATVKKDPVSGRSKGFGFVVFADAGSVDKVLDVGTITLQGRSIDPQRARGRSSGGGGRSTITKVFVGGVEPDVTESEIRQYFGTYGEIEDVYMPVDRDTNERRPFVFVTFDSSAAAEEACEERNHSLGGKEVNVRKATPKGDSGYGGGRGGGGFRGGAGRSGGSWGGGYGGRGSYRDGGYGGGRRNDDRGDGYDNNYGSRHHPYGRY